MLFEADRHEALAGLPWDPDSVAAAVRAMVTDFEAGLDPERFWRMHPLDDGRAAAEGFKSLYFGAAGVLWAMWYLAGRGAAAVRTDFDELIRRVHRHYLAQPDTGEAVPSYYLGEVGILLVLWRMTGDAAAADRLHVLIRENIPNPTNEALWAAPGTMVGALHMLGWTGEDRWHQLFLANVERLWSTWLPEPRADCYLWTQDLHGSVVQLLGAGHGFAGNVYPLLRGAMLLTEEQRETLYRRCVTTLDVTALREAGGVNWPAAIGLPRTGRGGVLMQWCHGAPGVVTATSDFPAGLSAEMDRLLLDAGTAVWRAGPLVKGCGLCHGTAGNGYAMLKLYRRTGDVMWLERARAFAMHALGQWDQARRRYGMGRYSLWTGDAGLAVYLFHCLSGVDEMPGLDLL